MPSFGSKGFICCGWGYVMVSYSLARWQNESSSGLLAALVAFIIWGFLPLYWNKLDALSPLEILSYRIFFSFIVLVLYLILTHRMDEAWQGIFCQATLWRILISSIIIGINWYLFIWAVTSGRVLECSLGYYMNPLMNVFFGFAFLKERPSRLQFLGLLCAVFGVLWSILAYGMIPWLGLSLAISFASYTFIRKTVAVESVPGLFIETLFLLPLAVGYLVWLTWQGQGFFHDFSLPTFALLSFVGPLTSLPLALFAFAARHMRMSTLGIIQYIAPTCQLFLGFFVFGELLTQAMIITFVCIWIGLIIYTLESLRLLRAHHVRI